MSQENMTTGADTSASPEGHDAAMAAKYDAANGVTAEPTSERPEWLPEKFNSAEDMAKAYAALESKIGQPKEPDPDPDPKGDVTNDDDDSKGEEEGDPLEQAAKAGVDVASISSEYDETGEISEESYAALAEAGFDKEIVDAYVAGQEAQATLFRTEALKTVGGEDNFAEISEWAATALSDAELNAFNAAVSAQDMSQVQLALTGLQARYETENGRSPQLVQGNRSTTSESFESWAQVSAAMKDSRYRTDTAYRKSVESKLAASNL